jgi:hypothetical protein
VRAVSKDQSTQTGEIEDEISKMCSISGIGLDKIFVPGENEQFLNTFLSSNMKFIQLHHIDTRNRKLVKLQIS